MATGGLFWARLTVKDAVAEVPPSPSVMTVSNVRVPVVGAV